MSENNAGKTVPIIGPTEGIKLNMNIKNAQKSGESIPTETKMM